MPHHYADVMMTTIAPQITSLTIVYSTIYSGADQSEHQSSASLAFVWGIHRGPVNSPHKWPVTRKIFPFDDVIMHGTWWCHQMETFSTLQALCVGNSPVTSEFPSQRPVTRSFDIFFDLCLNKLEQLERLRSEDTPRRLMITHTIGSYWIPSQKNNRSRTENITERTRFSKSRSNDLEDIGQGQRSSHATHLLMLVIICTKYGKNPSRTVDATERTRFSRSRPNDL